MSIGISMSVLKLWLGVVFISPFFDKYNQLPLDVLQLWDCFDYDITVVQKPLLSRCEFFGKDRKMHPGEYEFTIDNAHRDHSYIDTNFSEHDPEHKSFNVIRLDNGQFAAQPNNRVIWRDSSRPKNFYNPDFKVCTQNYCVETEQMVCRTTSNGNTKLPTKKKISNKYCMTKWITH